MYGLSRMGYNLHLFTTTDRSEFLIQLHSHQVNIVEFTSD